MKRVLLVVLFCLFVSSITNAQCAWVLWKSTTINFAETSKRWEIIIAVPTYEQCLMAKKGLIQNELESYRKLFGSADIISPDHILAYIPGPNNQRSLTNTLDYYCFPDTIDPRK